MAEKKLGRGLEYLLSKSYERSSDQPHPDSSIIVQEVPLSEIKTNRFQPRSSMDDHALKELMDSIRENGILQPIIVRRTEGRYELIAGERRYKACKLLDYKTIPSIVLEVPDNKMLQLALIENIQRENLTPIEEARAYQTLMELENLTHEALAKRVGKKRSTITNALRLLDLPKEIQDDVSRGTISRGHARALLAASTKEQMKELVDKIKKQGLTVRDTERLVQKINEKSHKVISNNKIEQKSSKTSASSHHLDDYANSLKDIYGTSVSIKLRGDGGEVSFSFYSHEDFTRLYLLLSKGITVKQNNKPDSISESNEHMI